MSNEWLNAESFERSYHLVSAINTISIHEKLEAAGVKDNRDPAEIRDSRRYLLEFLNSFEPVVRGIEGDPERLAEGVDPRLGELARGFLAAQRKRPQTSELANVSLNEISRLMESSDSEDRARFLVCLRDLRRLVEQHAHADVVKILGEL